tara:strand:- start:2163 stop:2501 length:339 start_codon:yes stop_codon:yes gene_type:complete
VKTPSLIYILKNLSCPQCGKQSVFQTYLRLKKRCHCGLKISNIDIGDAPSFFAMFFLNIFIILLAITVEIKFSPPLWIHIILWAPLIIILSILLIRYLKVIFLFLNFKYRNK